MVNKSVKCYINSNQGNAIVNIYVFNRDLNKLVD